MIPLEEKKDFREIESLTREAFWNVYHPGCFEHYVIHVLRNDQAFISELDYVYERDGKLIRSIVYALASIEQKKASCILLNVGGS